MNRVPRVVRIDVLYVKDPRVAFERSERLHGFGMRISAANARSPSLSFGDYARNNHNKIPV